jgi:hypothetical protein
VKLWRGHFQSKAGSQYVRLLARDRAEAKILMLAHQTMRAGREAITYHRIEETYQAQLADPKVPDALAKARRDQEIERRKIDFARYDSPVSGPATDPMKLVSIEEAK